MSKWIILFVSVLVMVGAVMIIHSETTDTLEAREASVADGLNRSAPTPMGAYSSITGAKARDGTLEIDVRLEPTAPAIRMDTEFRHGLAMDACKDPALGDLIKRGGAISYAYTTADGLALPVATISNCQLIG